mgnify:CR=1 FL=1
MFRYDKATGQVLGGDITMATDMRYEEPTPWGGTQVNGVTVLLILTLRLAICLIAL